MFNMFHQKYIANRTIIDFLLLVFQTAYRNHIYIFWPLVSIWSHSRNFFFLCLILHLCSINGLCKCFQSFSTIVYQFLSTQFHFYQCVCSISAMQYRVALQSRTVAIVIQFFILLFEYLFKIKPSLYCEVQGGLFS